MKMEPIQLSLDRGQIRRYCLCLLGILPLFGSSAGQAQNDADLSYLLFEPVALELTRSDTADGADGSNGGTGSSDYSAREITTLPAGPDRVALRSLITSFTLPALSTESADTPEAGGDASDNDDLIRYEASVQTMEIEGGAYEPGLVQELISLAQVYQDLDQHTEAIEQLERASHINRVNSGLFNLEQIPIIHELIESHLANGNISQADQQQEYLYYIQQKAFGIDSADILPALVALADWNVLTANLRLDPDLRDQLAQEPGFTFNPPGRYFGAEESRAQRLITAQNLYRSSIEIILKHFGIGDLRLLDMEKKLALTNYFFASYFSATGGPGFQNAGGGFVMQTSQVPVNGAFISGNSMGYRFGKDALERRIQYLQDNPEADPIQLVNAMIDLGDWYLLFEKRISATEIYGQAHSILRNADPGRVEDLFKPSLPVTLPPYSSSYYSREAYDIPADTALVYKGYIDVSFTSNRFGLAGSIDVIGRSSANLEEIENRLVRHLKNIQFRPRIEDGNPIEEDRFNLRYYFTY